jgi:isopenicillin N synthase-like dioxygenase
MNSASSAALDQILSQGHGTVRLDDSEAALLSGLYREATDFFTKDTPDKLRYSVPNRISGYRPFKYANTGSNDKPDYNDSFVYWRHRRASLPYQEEITGFLDAAEAYRRVTARIVRDLIEAMCLRYDYEHELPFEDASLLQINSFVQPVEATLYQYSHEDADLLTVIWASAPGLEGTAGEDDDEKNGVPYNFAPDEVLIMPGSLLTAMTGGAVPPFYHQVRNHNIRERKSIMYFVSPEATGRIEPFVRNDYNAEMDIQRLVVDNPQTYFGLSQDFVSA